MMTFIFGMQINIKVFYKLILLFWVSIARYAQHTRNKKFAYLCNIFRNTWGMKLIFLPTDKHRSFLQVDSITLGVCSQACSSTQNNKFAISLQYLKEKVKDEVDFLPADKHQRFLQIGTIIIDVCGQACPNSPT